MALHFTISEYRQRIKAAIASMQSNNLDGLLMFQQESMYHLTGYDSFGFCFFQCLYLGADGTLGVRADCNQCGGSYTLRDGRMTVGPLACTLIACPTNRGQEFASLLQGTTSLELEEGELEIESPDGTLVLTR